MLVRQERALCKKSPLNHLSRNALKPFRRHILEKCAYLHFAQIGLKGIVSEHSGVFDLEKAA